MFSFQVAYSAGCDEVPQQLVQFKIIKGKSFIASQ